MSNQTIENPTPVVNVTVNANVEQPSHWKRNVLASGTVIAAGLYALHGCGDANSPVSHDPVRVNPFAALSHVEMPEDITAVEADHATNKDYTRIYSAACTFKIWTPFGDKQGCTGDIGLFNGDTAAEVDGKLALVAYDKSMFVTAVKDDSEFGWHPLVVVNSDKFGVEMVDPVYTSDPLHKGVGNSMKQVAIHKFNDPNADEATYMHWLDQRASDAEKTACTPTLVEYVPASVAKIGKDWLLGGAANALAAKDPASHDWLTKLSQQVPHEEYLKDSDYNELLAKMHTGKFTKPETAVDDTIDTSGAAATTPDLATGISVAVPEAVPAKETYTFTIMGGLKKFTEEVYTKSTPQDCVLAPEDQAKLDSLKADGSYIVDAGRETGGH